MSDRLIQRYQADLSKPGFVEDSAQRSAVMRLQKMLNELESSELGSSFWFSPERWGMSKWRRPKTPPRGVYLWGGVGRGKTYLMDLFFETLPTEKKLRTHFHRFMRRVHGELTQLEGTKNPLQKVADRFAEDAEVICFDEFFVSDITDAMILANLLEALFRRGVALVATSNIEPQGLYQDGLQRVRFLPAIQLLLDHTDVLNVDAGTDYRLRELTRAELFYSPLGEGAEAALSQCFNRLVPDHCTIKCHEVIEIEGREIHAQKIADDIAWFEFSALCDGPRSQHDYIELAREYHAVVVSNVPLMGRQNDDQARRFVYLVDEFYDRGVKLIISAEQAIPDLYDEGKLKFEFDRTISRLREMQSEEYLAQPHKP